MTPVRHLTLDDPDYPPSLRGLAAPPLEVSIQGAMVPSRTVAIVGTRRPIPAAASFARELARQVARRGSVVVSGGAVGIDAAAHEGALDAGGRTWVVSGTGHGVLYPKQHGPLFERIVEGGGAMVWPFPQGTRGHPARFLQRNGVLVALAEVLVIVQAGFPSGALNAACWARRLGRPRWVVCPPPWGTDGHGFEGCLAERRMGARALTSIDFFFEATGTPPVAGSLAPARQRKPAETRVLAALSACPRHVDEVIAASGLPSPQVTSALLTLVLENVLVEGPEGFFRQASPP